MELHAKAQEVINQVNDHSMDALRQHFENVPEGENVVTLLELSRMHEGKDDLEPPLSVLMKMHAALVSSTNVHDSVQWRSY